ncbi:MAG: hypothetical protein DRP00_03870 [Candidatus Aenigmatarchaeota archaeon]|nr:MAG: hypothetical protein DRP00_03870 [Candidatus Aenigmarchaeota archaeon]
MVRCRRNITQILKLEYDQITAQNYGGNYLETLKNFDQIAENDLRLLLDPYYSNQRSRDQAWKNCKGELYEYAVFKYIESVINSDQSLQIRFSALLGSSQYRDQIAIRNWCDIYPDADILIVDIQDSKVKVIASCKTSLRERLTETAFWKRELERFQDTRDVKLIFITTDKDSELKQDVNRYIVQHVLDSVFITDPQKYSDLIRHYKQKYESQHDFNELLSKVKFIADFKDFLIRL